MEGQARLQIRFFGRLADSFGRTMEVDVEPDCRVADIRRTLAAACPHAAEEICSVAVRACVGGAIVSDDHAVEAGQDVDFFPTLSGG